MTTATALDVGEYVYRSKGWVDAMRLEKLVFFAQAWSLAWDGHALFDDEVEAWPDGPVVRELYRCNKYDRPGPYSNHLPGSDLSRLSTRQTAIIDAVLQYYGNWSAEQLSEASHTPVWQHARGNQPGRHSNGDVMPPAEIRRWYTRVSISDKTAPTPPSAGVPVVESVSQETIDEHIARWRGVLDLLAER